jgi:hypothetical protein
VGSQPFSAIFDAFIGPAGRFWVYGVRMGVAGGGWVAVGGGFVWVAGGWQWLFLLFL